MISKDKQAAMKSALDKVMERAFNVTASCNIMSLSTLTLTASGLGLSYIMLSVFGAVSAVLLSRQ